MYRSKDTKLPVVKQVEEALKKWALSRH
jgi:hypothetical protein